MDAQLSMLRCVHVPSIVQGSIFSFQERLRRFIYLQDVRAQLWATLERQNELPVAIADMTPGARAALVQDLLTKLREI